MNADSNKIRESLVDQLSSFEEGLDSKIDDVRMLADIQEGIGKLLGTTGGNEAEIRRVLQDRYESGDLRKETFQLVKSMLDRFVTEEVATSGTVILPRPDEATLAPVETDYVKTIADAAEELETEEPSVGATQALPIVTPSEPKSADERVQVGSVLRDRFMLQERVSGGSMGVVYKALDRRLAEAGTSDPHVAIKVLSPYLAENGQALRALQQEAAKGRCLTHPNIVRCIDLDRDEDLYFIVMEWLEGRTLADILDSPDGGKIKKKRAFEIVEQVGKALEYAHRCGIVHADVKPGNIMIMPNGDAKLFDFGVARVRQKQIEDRQEFDPGVLGLLTPAYSSMQVLTGEDPTPADDVFSLACLLYRLIAGYRVYGPRNAAEAAEEGMKPQCPQGLSDARWRVLKKALSYSRVARFATMTDFIEALDVGVDEPITLTVPARDDLDIEDESHGSGRWIVGLIVLLGLLGGTAYQFGYLDELIERYLPNQPELVALPSIEDTEVAAVEPALLDTTVDTQAETIDEVPADDVSTDESTDAATDAGFKDEVLVDLPLEADDEVAVEDEVAVLAEETPEETAPPLVDFSLLPPPTSEVRVNLSGSEIDSTTLTLREDRAPATVDIVRRDVTQALTLRLEEVGFSGNRSPLASGQYSISNAEMIEFPVGQERARVTLTMASDPLREADQQSSLRLRSVDTAASELATISVNLEDDDQRAFEATLPANTVAFAVSQISVRERDPAVQIDVLRFNPDNSRIVVDYVLRDITATQGEDYFAPGSYTIEFRPGQRSARLLIPLVQDFAFEDNEAFSVELVPADSAADVDVFLRTAVIIRDDDS
ncbi:MAG: protein kinase domain-containing protein [Woeseiaceae bacterium]